MTKNLNNYIDNVYKQIGEFGPYQLLVFILASTGGFVNSMFGLSYTFYAATPPHRCKIPWLDNDTYSIMDAAHQSLVDKYIPLSGKSIKGIYDMCNIKVYESENSSQFHLSPCGEWVFSREYFGKTMVEDWGLVCDKKQVKSLYSTIFFVSRYGILITGILSDTFGRKKTLYSFILMTLVISMGVSLVFNLENLDLGLKRVLFGVLRFLGGYFANLYNLSVVLAVEICGPSKRLLASNMAYYFFIFGEFGIVLVAYFIRDYRFMFPVFTIIFALIALYFWVVPESPRWLMIHERYKQAYGVFKKIATANNKPTDSIQLLKTLKTSDYFKDVGIEMDEGLGNESGEKQLPVHYSLPKTAKILITNKKTILETLALSINWFTNAMIYYGLSFNITELSGDPYLNFSISVAVELIAVILSNVFLDKYGRKIPYTISLSVSGLALFAILFVPKGWMVIALVMVGKCAISFSYSGIYLIIVEIYPTIIRNSALSINSFVASFGAVLSPNVYLLGDLYFYALPYIIFSALSCFSVVFFILVIPETKGKQLSDTVREFIDEN